MDTKYEIALYWSSPEGVARCSDMLTFVDAPSCFACHYSAEHWSKPASFEARWAKARLERAHIIARSGGGGDRAENLVLLCHDCHAVAPMVIDPREMLAWIVRRPKCLFSLPIHQVISEFQHLGRSIEKEFHGFDDRVVQRQINLSARQLGVGRHFGSKGPRVTPSSWAIVLKHAADSLKRGQHISDDQNIDTSRPL